MKNANALLTIILSALTLVLLSCGPSQEELKISALDHFNRGNAYFTQQRMLAAANEYKKAIALDSGQDRFYYNLGLVYYSLVLYEKSIEEYWKAIERNPKFSEVWYNLALAYEKVDKTEDAFMAYEKYQRLNATKKAQKKEAVVPKVLPKPGG